MCQGEQYGEYFGWEVYCFQCDVGIEVDIWVEFFFDEVFVFQGDMFQFYCDLQGWIVVNVQYVQNFVIGFMYDFCVWIVIFVDVVFEVYQLEWIGFVFGFGDVFWDFVDGIDFVEYVECGFVGIIVCWFLQGGNVCSDICKWIGVGRIGQVNCGG